MFASYAFLMELLDRHAFKKVFERHLHTFFVQKKKELKWIKDAQLRGLIEHAMTITEADGKRIRPYLGYLGYHCVECTENFGLFDMLVALELFHAFALIHDDIIDIASRRHGLPTTHKKCTDGIGKITHSAIHYGNSQAILVGDLFHIWSQEVLMKYSHAYVREAVSERFSEMVQEVIVGQMIDVSFSLRTIVSMRAIEEKNRLKTARYSFVHPLIIGASIAVGSAIPAVTLKFFNDFGTAVGTAFQIQDDLIDIIGDTTATGKETFHDIAEGQHTYITQYVYNKGSITQKALLKKRFGKQVPDKDKNVLLKLFTESGAIDNAQRIVTKKLTQAVRVLGDASLPRVVKDSLSALVATLAKRNA